MIYKYNLTNSIYPNIHKWDRSIPYQRVAKRTLFGLDYLLKKGDVTIEQSDRLKAMYLSNDPEMRRLAQTIANEIWRKRQSY